MEPQQDNSVFALLSALFLDFIQVVVMSLAIFVVVYIFVFQPNMVKGRSMETTFMNGEYLLTDKLTFRWVREPERGDIVVFRSPENNNFDFIKRIIAVPGDTVSVEKGRVAVNGVVLEENYLDEGVATRPGAFLKEGATYTVPDEGYVVFGDNRDYSSDSREWGPVPKDNLIGRAWFRYWPLTKVGLVNSEKA